MSSRPSPGGSWIAPKTPMFWSPWGDRPLGRHPELILAVVDPAFGLPWRASTIEQRRRRSLGCCCRTGFLSIHPPGMMRSPFLAGKVG